MMCSGRTNAKRLGLFLTFPVQPDHFDQTYLLNHYTIYGVNQFAISVSKSVSEVEFQDSFW